MASSRRPRKKTRRVGSAGEAITTTVMAIADAATRRAGINLETTFPGGRMHVLIGEISVTTTGARKEDEP